MSGTNTIGEMNLYDSTMFWGTIFMVILEVMIVLLLVYDVGLHTIWSAYCRKKSRLFKRKLKRSADSFITQMARKIGKKGKPGRRKK